MAILGDSLVALARIQRAVVVVLGLGVALPAAASAASTPVQIGTFPVSASTVELPSVAVDGTGTAYVVWADLAKNLVDYCVLPDGASGCAQSGTLAPVLEPGASPQAQPSAPALSPSGHVVEVLINAGTVSIIAETQGPADQATPGTGGSLQETEMWQAPDGGSNFALVNNGSSVAYPQPRVQNPTPGYSNYVEPSYLMDGVVVPGSGELGEFDFSPGGPPSFEAFAQTSPPACSELSHPPCAFATLEPSSNPDPVSNFGSALGRQIASESTPAPGILGFDLTYNAAGPFACTTPSGDHLSEAYVYGSGLQSPTNSYSISPGQPNSAWKVPATQVPGECPVADASIAGGPSGFGLFEALSGAGLRYRPFDSATASFDAPAVTVDSTASGAGLGLAQDGAGNIYATEFVQNQGAGSPGGSATFGAPLALFYSADGGKTWQGPGPLDSTIQPGFNRSQISVGADGKGWMVITAAGSVFALEFSAADAANSFSASIATPPPVTNASLSVPVSCYVVPCTVSTTLSGVVAQAAGNAHAHAHVAAAAAVGTASLAITTHGLHTLTIPLSPGGATALSADGGKLPVSLGVSTALGPYSEQKTLPLTLTEALPVLSKLKLSPRALRTAGSGASVTSTRARTGARVSYSDTLAAKTVFVVTKPDTGRLSNGICEKPPRKARGKHRRCTRWVSIGSFSHSDRAGANKFRFSGRVSRRSLAPGSYRLLATPTFEGATGATVAVAFTVRAS